MLVAKNDPVAKNDAGASRTDAGFPRTDAGTLGRMAGSQLNHPHRRSRAMNTVLKRLSLLHFIPPEAPP